MNRVTAPLIALSLAGCSAGADRTSAVPSSTVSLEPLVVAPAPSATPPDVRLDPVVAPGAEHRTSAPVPAPAPLVAPYTDDAGPPDMVIGNADGFKRGLAGGVVGTAPPAPPTGSRARPKPAGWQCPFPPESDKAAVDTAIVWIQVIVLPTGRPESVVVLRDPGLGFGREAQRCAMSQMYEPARDGQNHPVRGETYSFRVRFVR